MKKIGLIILFILFSQTAFALENTGAYIGFSGGFVIPQTMRISDPDNSSDYMDATLKNGYLVGVKSGWITPFTRKIMAMEMEYNYIFNADFDKDKIVSEIGPGVTLDGTMRIHALMFNLKARFPEGLVHPYIGAGLGYSYFQGGDIAARVYGSLVEVIPGESGGGFCYQFLAGVDFDITPNISLAMGYKYFAALPTIGSKGSGGGIYADLDYRASMITMGLTFTF